MQKTDSLNNTPESYVKLYAQESTREIIKARVTGKVFRMPDFEKIQQNPNQYEGEIQRWKTAIKKALKEDVKGYGKKHLFAWGVEDDKIGEEYANLPENGVPSNKTELVALIEMNRLGPKIKRQKLKDTDDDSAFNDVIKELTGGVVTTFATYVTETVNAEIAKHVELTRLTLSAALNNEMEVPFMKGQYPNYKAVMEWVDSKTEFETKTEYMHELFKHIDDAMAGDGQVDSKCMEYRMALDLLYIDKPLVFKDWEHADAKAETFEPESYTPALSFMFFYLYKKELGDEAWKKIEEEFRREIGTENYNKVGWMQNKPKLFKIIKKYCKNKPKAKVASLVDTSNTNDNDSDEEVEIDMEDGVILKVQPKFRGNGSSWKRNFTKKFNLQQSGHNRWQRRNQSHQSQQQQQPRQNQNSNRNQNQGSKNNVEHQKHDGPNADQWWRCYRCRDSGSSRKFKGNQKCPVHNFRPKYFDSVPLSGVRELKPQNVGNDDDEGNNTGNGNGHLASIRDCLLYNNSSESD